MVFISWFRWDHGVYMGKEKLTCPACGQSFGSKEELEKHKLEHKKEKEHKH